MNVRTPMPVGIPQLDDQHDELLELVERLDAALAAGDGGRTLAAALDEFVRVTKAHFAAEERLMVRHKYVHSAAHHREHSRFVADVSALRRKLAAGDASRAADLVAFVRAWLPQHIAQADTKVGQALNAKARLA